MIEGLSPDQTAQISKIGAQYRKLAEINDMTPWDARLAADQQIRQINLDHLINPPTYLVDLKF